MEEEEGKGGKRDMRGIKKNMDGKVKEEKGIDFFTCVGERFNQ